MTPPFLLTTADAARELIGICNFLLTDEGWVGPMSPELAAEGLARTFYDHDEAIGLAINCLLPYYSHAKNRAMMRFLIDVWRRRRSLTREEAEGPMPDVVPSDVFYELQAWGESLGDA